MATKHIPVYEGGGYNAMFLTHYKLFEVMNESIKTLEPIKDSFDAIAFRGMSGAIPAGILSIMLEKPLILVRKSRNDNHAGCLVEGDSAAKTYIIVDDFICSGETIKAIVKGVLGFTHGQAKCVGILRTKYPDEPIDLETYMQYARNVEYLWEEMSESERLDWICEAN